MENTTELQTLRIGEKHYSMESVTELAVNLLNDIKKIEEEMNRINLQFSITKLAKLKLIDELTKELPKMTEVPAPEVQVDKEAE
jgi:hypothetical protein